MTVSASKRLGALAIASLFVVGACGGGATPSPSTAASEPAGASAPPPASVAAVEGEVSISGSSTVQPISQLVSELFNEQPARTWRWPSTAPAPATGSSCSARATSTSPMPRGTINDDERRSSAPTPASSTSSSRSRSTACRSSRAPRTTRRHVPLVRRPLRPDRAGVRGCRQLGRRPGAGDGARLDDDPADRAARDQRSRRGVGHVRLLRRADRRRVRRGSRPGGADPQGLQLQPERQRDHPGHRGHATPRSAGSATPSPRRPAISVKLLEVARSPTASASRRRPRRSPATSTRSRATCSSTSTRPRPQRTRRWPRTSTSTWPRARSPRPTRKSATWTSRRRSWPSSGRPGKPADLALLLQTGRASSEARPVSAIPPP